MPSPVAHAGAAANCPHGGAVAFVPTGPRVFVNGAPVATMADKDTVGGCAFNVSGSPHPCLRITWRFAAQRVTSNLSPVVLQVSAGVCLAGDQAPQGPPIIRTTQPRVLGT